MLNIYQKRIQTNCKWTFLYELRINNFFQVIPYSIMSRSQPISANPRLNCPYPRNKFITRLNSVPRSSSSTIERLNWGLNLTHQARWINSLTDQKGKQTNQSRGLKFCWLCFKAGPGEERKVILSPLDVTIFSRTSPSAPAKLKTFLSYKQIFPNQIKEKGKYVTNHPLLYL